MPIDVHPKRTKGKTPEEITQQQKEDAEALRRQKANVPAKVAAAAPAPTTIDTRTPEEAYLDEIAPSTLAGQMIKFSKEGQFIVRETQEEISPDREFVALCDETLIGWVKFNGEGEPPERRQGLYYHGFVMPPRASLGDMDQSQWPDGLNGAPEDPWQHQMCLVLQDPESTALFTFVTSSPTGRRGVGNLLQHYKRLRNSHPGSNPVVRLKPSGFHSKKKGVGWVPTPSFVVVKKTAAGSTAPPDTSPGADLNDSIPY
jgi:hypothetical protein